MPEICRRPAYVMDITLEIAVIQETFCLSYQRIMAPCLYDPPLMKGKRAEITAAKTPPVADQAKPHFRDRRYAAFPLIGRVIRPHIGITIDLVHLRLIKRHGRRILHDILALPIRFHQPFPGERIRITILCIEAFGI